VAHFVLQKLYLLTGCFNSKMEQALIESYKEEGLVYGRDRVFNNYSGNRPAEPTSVAAAATWHSLTHIFMEIVKVTRKAFPNGRLLHPWERDFFAGVIVRFFFRVARRKRHERIRIEKQKALRGERPTFISAMFGRASKLGSKRLSADGREFGRDTLAANRGSAKMSESLVAAHTDDLGKSRDETSSRKLVRIVDPIDADEDDSGPTTAVADLRASMQRKSVSVRASSSRAVKVVSTAKVTMNLSDGDILDIQVSK
jgi:hypothetical protein